MVELWTLSNKSLGMQPSLSSDIQICYAVPEIARAWVLWWLMFGRKLRNRSSEAHFKLPSVVP